MHGARDGRGSAEPAAGFTLVELVVVISVIALMMAIVLPMLGKSRRVAMAGACLSNQKQLMVAIEAFTIENKGRYPARLPTTAGGAIYTAAEPAILLTQNGQEDLDFIELPELPPARPKSWVAAASSRLRQVSIGFTAEQPNDAFGYPRFDAPEFVCPADDDPVGPTFGGWMPDESINRSYVFNGYNDFKHTVAEWRNDLGFDAVPQDAVTQPSATATLGEKKSGPDDAHRFHVDVFGDFNETGNPVDILVQDRHDSGGNHAFADGSAKLMKPFESATPENLWGLKEATRQEFTDIPRDLGQDDII
ncbi:MAG: prepilin-type N-terminal cleavage/methylation domain-containing protein [Planctomycetota bacterium]